ncbi:MAG: hypothetical protein H7067_15005 [Burkholderiales bacterium]|nr:hypothetical protein [Opitutaceae bacterium]
MALKIKSNDDRILSAVVALLFLTRGKLAAGQTGDLVGAAVAEYREDTDAFKEAHPKRDLETAKEAGPLKDARQLAYYKKLTASAETLLGKIQRNKIQFNSLTELDNYLVANLGRVGIL